MVDRPSALTRPRAALPVSLDVVLLTAQVVLVVASTVRYLTRHSFADRGWAVLLAATALVVAQVFVVRSPAGSRGRPLATVLAVLVCAGLVLLAPSFAWCTVPVAFAVLAALPAGPAIVVTCALGVLVTLGWARVTGRFDLTLLVGPTAMAMITVAAVRTLQQQSAARERLVGQLLAAQEDLAREQRRSGALDERNRVARDLHDSVGQTLASVGLVLEAAGRDLDRDPGRARERLDVATEAARTALVEVRAVVADLARPSHASGERLVARLRDLVGDLSPPVRGTVQVHGDVSDLSAPVADALLMSARGAVANAREHAHARTVTVTLTRLDDEVLLDVLDDGNGFDPSAARGPAAGRGHGLDGIRARAVALGGTMTLETAAGEGTTVSLGLPVRAGSER